MISISITYNTGWFRDDSNWIIMISIVVYKKNILFPINRLFQNFVIIAYHD